MHHVNDTLSNLLSHSDLVFVYTTYGFAQIVDKMNAPEVVKKSASRKKTPTRKQTVTEQKCCNRSRSITVQAAPTTNNGSCTKQRATGTVGCRNQQTPVVNKVCATVSSRHIIESDRQHNTRKTRPKIRTRNNPRAPRTKTIVDYRECNDSSDASSDRWPSKSKKPLVVSTMSLSVPSESRIAAQKMITRKRLQDLSPVGSQVKLIGTAISPKPIIPAKAIKLET